MRKRADYVLDLKYFHEQSYNIKIIPIVIVTDAVDFSNTFDQADDGVLKPIRCKTVLLLSQQFGGNNLDPIKWKNSIYKPTQLLYKLLKHYIKGIM